MIEVCQMSDSLPVSASSPSLPQTAVKQAPDVPDRSKYPIAISWFSGCETRGPPTTIPDKTRGPTVTVTEKNWGNGSHWVSLGTMTMG